MILPFRKGSGYFLSLIPRLIVFAILFITIPLVFAPKLHAEKPLLIASASNLRFAMDEVISTFKKETQIIVKVAYGASGNLMTQIMAGAPYDIFFSADTILPRKLITEKIAIPESFFIYGAGQIVLWVPLDSEIDIKREGLDALLHPSVNKIAIANPRHAPYGMAAISMLKDIKFYDRLHHKLVIGENIGQAAEFVRKGAAEIGILSYSLAVAPPLKKSGHYGLIAPERHTSLEQAAVILQRSPRIAQANSFLDFLQKGKGREIMNYYGYLKKEKIR